jgi:hypothetical protein
MSGNGDLEGLRKRAIARGIAVPDSVLASALASLRIQKHLLLFGDEIEFLEAIVELIADDAADSGASYGTLVVPPETAALIPLKDILLDPFRRDFWVVLRRTDAVALRRIIDQLRTDGGQSTQRLLATTTKSPRVVLRDLTPAARRLLSLVEVTNV